MFKTDRTSGWVWSSVGEWWGERLVNPGPGPPSTLGSWLILEVVAVLLNQSFCNFENTAQVNVELFFFFFSKTLKNGFIAEAGKCTWIKTNNWGHQPHWSGKSLCLSEWFFIIAKFLCNGETYLLYIRGFMYTCLWGSGRQQNELAWCNHQLLSQPLFVRHWSKHLGYISEKTSPTQYNKQKTHVLGGAGVGLTA